MILRDIIYMQAEPTQKNLSGLKGYELECVCGSLGIATSGTKETQIKRILAAWDVRKALIPHKSKQEKREPGSYLDDNPFDFWPDYGLIHMAKSFLGRELKAMCKKAGCSQVNGTKKAMCGSLLTWRLGCRRKGEKYLKSLFAEFKDKGYHVQPELW